MSETSEDNVAPGGNVLQEAARLGAAGQHREAVGLLAQAAAAEPGNRDVLLALARSLQAAGQRREAFMTFNRLIALGDVSAETWNAIGQALITAMEYAQAIGAFEQSLAVAETAEARHHLGEALFKLGDMDGAIGHLEKAARESGLLASWLALATMIPGAPGATQADILRVRREFAGVLAASPLAADPVAPVRRERSPGEPIRVGYVSSWFTSSNYMKPVWALINNHDRERFEVHLFSDSPADAALEGYVRDERDRLHVTGNLDNTWLARLIAETGIDVLVDLNAYSTPQRLGLFTSHPAPVTVAWFNMYATSGLPGFHYIIGDDEVVTGADEPFFSERVLRLPMSYLTFTTPHRTPPVVDPPCVANGYLTFGSLIAQYKMTGDVIDAWAEILRGAPDSRLFLANRALGTTENKRWVEQCFVEKGIDPGRLDFGGPAPHYDYLQNYDRIDVALDAFPYNGGTTTMEAIWQGVPVLTFDGGRWASRTSQTLLRRTHLGGYAHESREAMIEGAIAMARDPGTPEELKRLRHAMRAELERAPVCDAISLARAMEDILASLAADV